MDIARGYEPVAKLDTNIMASRQALSKMDFPTSEIDKIDAVNKEREHFIKRSKEIAKEFDKSVSPSSECPVCDICGNITGIGTIKLASQDDEAKIPPDWSPFALAHFGSPNCDDYRAYVLLPSGIVIDYQSRKVYVVCGSCRVVLALRSTESVILIHSKTEGTGYGFVDLDRVEKIMQTCKELRSAGNVISPLIDFDMAIQMWRGQPQ